MNELKLKLPGGGLLTIRKVAGEEQDSVMVEFFEPGENPDMDIGHGSHMTANVFAGAVKDTIYTAEWRASHTGAPQIVSGAVK